MKDQLERSGSEESYRTIHLSYLAQDMYHHLFHRRDVEFAR